MSKDSQHKDDDQPASWSSLPRKSQIGILTLCRVFDYMQVASFQTVCYYQLKSFSPALSEQTLSWQSGVASGSFSGAQILTSMIWGRAADAEWCGRKRVLLIGLFGTALSCMGLAFSRSFPSVVAFRFLAGVFHVTIGTVRTMMAENTQERKYQARAFLLLPAAVMVASILGSVCGSLLADPIMNYPSLLDMAATFGVARWTIWMKMFPYAPPALFNAVSLLFMGFFVFLMIEETLEYRKHRPDLGIRLFAYLKRKVRNSNADSPPYYVLLQDDSPTEDTESIAGKFSAPESLPEKRYDFRGIWTFNIVAMLFAQAIFDFHMGAFDSLLPLFLSTPRSSAAQRLSFVFSGGLGMEPRKVATALTMVGFVGLALQFIFYPRINARLGNVRIFRLFTIAFPLAYCLIPFLVIISSNNLLVTWSFIAATLTIHAAGRIFVMPVTIALLNNCAADPSVLGTINGIGQTTTAIFRTAGPICSGYLFGIGLERNTIGTVWWVMAIVAIMGWVASLFIRERHGSLQSTTRTRRGIAVEAYKKL